MDEGIPTFFGYSLDLRNVDCSPKAVQCGLAGVMLGNHVLYIKCDAPGSKIWLSQKTETSQIKRRERYYTSSHLQVSDLYITDGSSRRFCACLRHILCGWAVHLLWHSLFPISFINRMSLSILITTSSLSCLHLFCFFMHQQTGGFYCACIYYITICKGFSVMTYISSNKQSLNLCDPQLVPRRSPSKTSLNLVLSMMSLWNGKRERSL